MNIISIPEKYWLKIENFDLNSFTYEDINLLKKSPEYLLNDFRQLPYFDEICENIIQKYKNIKNESINPLYKNKTPKYEPCIIDVKESPKKKCNFIYFIKKIFNCI